MPTYEYACKGCGDHLEIVQSFRDEALTTCPNCGGALRKVFGSIGIAFKGSGFYKTDSRSASKSDSPSSASDGSDSGTKKTEKTPGTGDKATPTSTSNTSAGSSSGSSGATSAGSGAAAAS
jgi:putative FmdB family regulatory protein